MKCPNCGDVCMLHAEYGLCVCSGCKLTGPRHVFAALAKRLSVDADNARWVRRIKELEARLLAASAVLAGGVP